MAAECSTWRPAKILGALLFLALPFDQLVSASNLRARRPEPSDDMPPLSANEDPSYADNEIQNNVYYQKYPITGAPNGSYSSPYGTTITLPGSHWSSQQRPPQQAYQQWSPPQQTYQQPYQPTYLQTYQQPYQHAYQQTYQQPPQQRPPQSSGGAISSPWKVTIVSQGQQRPVGNSSPQTKNTGAGSLSGIPMLGCDRGGQENQNMNFFGTNFGTCKTMDPCLCAVMPIQMAYYVSIHRFLELLITLSKSKRISILLIPINKSRTTWYNIHLITNFHHVPPLSKFLQCPVSLKH